MGRRAIVPGIHSAQIYIARRLLSKVAHAKLPREQVHCACVIQVRDTITNANKINDDHYRILCETRLARYMYTRSLDLQSARDYGLYYSS